MDSLPVVVVTHHASESPVDLEVIRSQLAGRASIRVISMENRKPTLEREEAFIKQMREAIIIFQRPGFITRNMIEACPHLKFVITHGSGVDKIDLKACEERKVWVGNVPGGNMNAVAELVVAGILALLRKLMVANASVHRGGWKKGRVVGRELSEGVLGIIGFGHVGRRVAQIVSGFGTKILFYDPFLDFNKLLEVQGVRRFESLEEVLSKSDYISIHVPLTKATTKFIGLDELKRMKSESILVNTSRGGVIDEGALYIALREGMIGGAVLDVFSVEPLPKNSPLRRLSNVILTPHVAGSTKECLRRIAQQACDEILLVLSGEKPKNLVENLRFDLSSRA
jgi:phosphoglycerate dehydrogenase-like enzyme